MRLCKSREETAKLVTVMSHEGTHYYGNRVEGIAHLQGLATYNTLSELPGMKGDSSFADEMADAIRDKNSWKENSGDTDYWLLKTDGSIVWDGSKNLNVEYYDEWGNLKKLNEHVKDNTGSFSESLANYVGQERAEQLLGSSYQNTDNYDFNMLKDVLQLSDEQVRRIQHSGKLTENLTESQKNKLLGESLMKQNGMNWESGKGWQNGESLKISMSDHDIGQIVINPIRDDSGNITGYDRFGIVGEVYRDSRSYSSSRKVAGLVNYAEDGYQGLDSIVLSKKDLNGNIIESTIVDEFSYGWQTVANGYSDSAHNIQTYSPDNVYRDATMSSGSDFYMRFGNFESMLFAGNVFIINRGQTIGIGTLDKSGYSSNKNNGRNLDHSNILKTPYLHVDSGGLISAACFMNTESNVQKLSNWIMSQVEYSYDVKSRIYDLHKTISIL